MSERMEPGSKAYEPRELQNPGVIEAFAAAVMSLGTEKMAKRLRKAQASLYGEMNPNGDQKKFKLSVDDALEATRVLIAAGRPDAVTWLSMLAEDLGYSLIPNDSIPDKGTVAEESTDDVIELGTFTRVVNDPKATIKDVRQASVALRREVRQTEALKVKEISKRDALRKR